MINNLVSIGGIDWDVRILSIEEEFEIRQSDSMGYTIAAGNPVVLDPLGTWYAHRVKFGKIKGQQSEFDALYDFLSRPRRDGLLVKMVHGQSSIEYLARVENGKRKVELIDIRNDVVEWSTFEAKFIAMKAQVLP